VYLSRDDAKTFTRVLDGLWTLGISDFAELLLAATVENNTNYILYSYNQGLNWSIAYFDTELVTVNAIIVVLDNSQAFSTNAVPLNFSNPTILIYATDSLQTNYIYWMNFSQIVPPCSNSDIEQFNPEGGQSTCVLGRQTTYFRKKQTSLCQATLSDYWIVQDLCACGNSDYLCHYCFIKNASGACVFDTTNSDCPSDPGIPNGCVPGQTYSVASQYVKVIGDVCVGSVPQYENNRTVVCPNSIGSNSSTGGYIALGVILGILFLGGIAFLIFWFVIRPSSQKATFDDKNIGDMKSPREDLPVGDI